MKPRSAIDLEDATVRLTASQRTALSLLAICALALGLRLAVWHWREFYALGGDEQAYLQQALHLLQQRRYRELELMRPPLYTLFLATSIQLADSLVDRLRLIQALLSSATVPLFFLLTRQIFGPGRVANRAALVAALLAALSYTLAASAAELLSETLFLAILTLSLALLLRAGRTAHWPLALAAGLFLGLAALTRSVALPLLPLGALWLLAAALRERDLRRSLRPTLALLLGCALVVAPWTARNYAVYGTLIMIDTTGAENLWLDNAPEGRDAVKAALLLLGDDRAARQQLATAQGLAAISADPARFVSKSWGELQKLFALEHADDLRARPAIWVPPAEVAARLALGDGLWLLLLSGGLTGLWLAPRWNGNAPDPRWLLVPWAGYVALTCVVFHVEPRYRLPVYVTLLPYAGWLLAGSAFFGESRQWRPRIVGAALSLLLAGGMTLAHRPYLSEGWMLTRKHLLLAAAQHALGEHSAARAEEAASGALALDPRSALAPVALARAALARGDEAAAERWLTQATGSIPAHPYAHLLQGDLWRTKGRVDEARTAFGFETASLQDLQRWTREAFTSQPPARLDLGDLDLGSISGFFPCVEPNCPAPRPPQPFRWSSSEAQVTLTRAASGTLRLRLAAPRPAGFPPPRLTLLLDGALLATIEPGSSWQTVELPLPPGVAGPTTLTLRSTTFRPRDADPASPDGRQLGVQLDWLEALP